MNSFAAKHEFFFYVVRRKMLTRFIEESKWQRAEEKLQENNNKHILVELHYSTNNDVLMHYWAFALIDSRRVSMQVPKEIPPFSKAIIHYMAKKI